MRDFKSTTQFNLNATLLRLIGIFFGFSGWAFAAVDPDLSWHLLGGQYVASHLAQIHSVSEFLNGDYVPREDFINTFRTFWHDYHWLFQYFLFRVYEYGSYPALSVLSGMFSAFAGLICAELLIGKGGVVNRPLIKALLLLGLIVLVRFVSNIRPQIAAIPVIGFTLLLLRNAPWRWELILLFPLAILFANIHVYWVFIPFLWFSYRCLPRFRKHHLSTSWYSWGGLFLLSSAALFSPYGLLSRHRDIGDLVMNYSLIWDYLHTPTEMSFIGEFNSILGSFLFQSYILLIIILLVARSFTLMRARASVTDTGVGILIIYLAATATKFIGLLPMLAAPLIAQCERHSGIPEIKLPVRLKTFILSVVAIAAFIFAASQSPMVAATEQLTQINDLFPVNACAQIGSLKLQPQAGKNYVTVLTHFNYGSWCMWSAVQADPTLSMRVTTDGRTQGFPPEFFQKGNDTYAMKEDWDKVLVTWAPDLILAAREQPIGHVLPKFKGRWTTVYGDNRFVLLKPVRNE